jgi:hypothetical protein
MVIPLGLTGLWLLFAPPNLGAMQQKENCKFCIAQFTDTDQWLNCLFMMLHCRIPMQSAWSQAPVLLPNRAQWR